MASLGLVTIVKNNEVLFKCVARSNGRKAIKLADKIKGYKIEDLSIPLLYSLCVETGFGSDTDLVIQSPTKNYCLWENDFSHLYKDKAKFEIPDFHPAWECGLCDTYMPVNF